MAHTRAEYTIAAGFGGVEVLTKLGEAFFGLGLMGSANGWYDSFTDTGGSEVRILEMAYTGNSGTYNKVYHAYFTDSVFDGLWYTMYYDWDASTHASNGVTNLDFVRFLTRPDATTDFGSYYAKLADMSNATDFKIITYSDGTSMPILRLTNVSETRVFAFVPTASTLRGVSDYNEYGPTAMLTTSVLSSGYYTAGALVATDRSISGRDNSGSTTNDWSLSTGLGSHAGGSGLGSTSLGSYITVNSLAGEAGLFARSGAPPRTPYYTIARNIPACGAVYDSLFGENFGVISGINAGSFTPSFGDTLVVNAGVEEYEVLQIISTSTRSDWAALLSRAV